MSQPLSSQESHSRHEGESSNQEDQNQTGLGSVGYRNSREESRVSQALKIHGVLIMTTVGISTLAFVSGFVMCSWFWTGPQHDTNSLIKETKKGIFEELATNDTLLFTVLNRSLEKEETRKKLTETLFPLFKEEAKNVTIREKNVTRIQYQCLLESEDEWRRFEGKLRAEGVKIEKECKKELEQDVAKYKQNVDDEMRQIHSGLSSEMMDLKVKVGADVTEMLTKEDKKIDDKIGQKTSDVETKLTALENRLNLADQILVIKGFLKIDHIGPILVAIVVVEVLLVLGTCLLFRRGVAAASRMSQRGRAAVPNGDALQPARAQQPPPPPPLISTNNNNVTCMCFRDADEELSRRLGTQLVRQGNNGRIVLQTFVVNSMEDVQEIPACRAALVFVDPDEREMLIEDERYHIGQGLRRHAVQRLLDSGVEVFIIIFNDKKSVTLSSGQLYNPKLGQIDEHAQLKKLKRKTRIVSIKDQFHEHQMTQIVREFNTIFG